MFGVLYLRSALFEVLNMQSPPTVIQESEEILSTNMEDVNDLAREGFPVELPQDLKLLPHDAAAAKMVVQAEKAPPLQRKQQSMRGSNFGQRRRCK